jgi:hypothetical protein
MTEQVQTPANAEKTPKAETVNAAPKQKPGKTKLDGGMTRVDR